MVIEATATPDTHEPWRLTALYVATIIPADFVMSTGMLRRLKSRVDQGATPLSSGRKPLHPELYLARGERGHDFSVRAGPAIPGGIETRSWWLDRLSAGA
jgi:hypothetical protein